MVEVDACHTALYIFFLVELLFNSKRILEEAISMCPTMFKMLIYIYNIYM